ncbi:MAG: Na(+)-translocating NADH-quinone reductase subunit F [Planctomycetes bacterium ADurb.Bin401]|nr:MAG: Na(+)-translocating NADH-quinone reductase subunit F [Planctomycetes bacterium ADurb.Bin401]
MIITLIISVLIVSAIGAALAFVLVLSEKKFNDYGQCKININEEKELIVTGGKNLLSALGEEKIFIPSACGGRGTCGLCKLKVLEGGGSVLPTEEPFLDKAEIASNMRLSCQVKVRNDLKIFIPPELFAIREYNCKCVEITDLTYDIKQFRFELVDPSNINFIPGQFMQFLTPVYDTNTEETYRAYSISSDPADKNHIELIIRLVPNGICTTYCFKYLKIGDPVRLNGPYGLFRLTDTDAPIVFIAGGSGMAPIKCMLHHMKNTNNKRKATYYFGANKLKDLCCVDLMHQFEKELANFRFVPSVAATEPGETWAGVKGLVTNAINDDLQDASNSEAYLCGSPGMIDAVIKLLRQKGIDEKNIFYDKFE